MKLSRIFITLLAFLSIGASAQADELPARIREAMIKQIQERCSVIRIRERETVMNVDEYDDDKKENVYRTEFSALYLNPEGYMPTPALIIVTAITEQSEDSPIDLHGVEANYGGVCR